jgi:glycosyltransferase involved in cell wall biosynthesis
MIINGGYPGSDICLAAVFAFRKINPKKEIWINFHNLAIQKFRNPLLNMYKNIIDYLIIKTNCKFISVSKISSKSINKRFFLKGVKVKTIYNGLKKTLIGNNVKLKLRKKYNLKKNDLIILLLAEYDDRKGYSYIFKTMEVLLKKKKNIYLIAFGDGNLHFFKKKIMDMNLSKNIFLNCFCSSNIELIKQSDIISIPSQEYESFGYVALEAMSVKKIVIATKCGGLNEIIKNNYNGYLAKVEDPNDFAKKILFVINNIKEISIIKKNAYNIFRKKFCYDKMNKSYEKLIEKY